MNRFGSRRTFVAAIAGAWAAFAANIGRAFGRHGADGTHAPRNADTRDTVDGRLVATYTYDRFGRLLSVTQPTDAARVTFGLLEENRD
ncbi:MAG: hypothetical protein ACREHD_09565 [Pirellulales bacterium]